MNQSIGTPVTVTSNGLATGVNVNVSAITVTPKGGDVVVQFKNGSGGDVLWEIEADASSGSHSVSFPSPIHFSSGVYVVADTPAFLTSVSIATV